MSQLINMLLVEDDEVDIMNVQRAFKKNKIGNPLFVARNGVEALSMLRGEPELHPAQSCRIILLDINMPKHIVFPVYQEDFDGPKEKYAEKKAGEVFQKFGPP